MKRFVFAAAAALAATMLYADVLDELMPRPRVVMHGADAVAKLAVHDLSGAYCLRVKGGRPMVTGDAEGQRLRWRPSAS